MQQITMDVGLDMRGVALNPALYALYMPVHLSLFDSRPPFVVVFSLAFFYAGDILNISLPCMPKLKVIVPLGASRRMDEMLLSRGFSFFFSGLIAAKATYCCRYMVYLLVCRNTDRAGV